MPTAGGSAVASTGHFVNDLVAWQEVPGVEKAAWTLDPLQRFSTQSTFAWVNEGWASSTDQVLHYDGDGDEPGWIVEDATQPDEVTRWVEGADGQVAVQTSGTGDRVLQLVDLHGDVVGTVPVVDGADGATWSDLRLSSFDGFGNALPLSGAASANAPPARYGWLGAAQRSADTPTGVLLMGVRLYHPLIGRFLQVDPVAGGSANAYDYCNADPVNCTDLGGTIAWGKALGIVAAVGSVASFIPGPIGAAAGAVSAVAYGLSGNPQMAATMAVVAAAQLVGAGPAVRVGAAFLSRGSRVAKEFKSTRELGIQAHRAFERYVVRRGGQPASQYIKNCGGGRRCKPDGNLNRAPVELKPNDARAIAQGHKQLDKYERATGTVGQGRLYTYRQVKLGPLKWFRYKRVR